MQENSSTRTRFQKFQFVERARSAIQKAPYNPRKLDKWAAEKLRKKLRKTGLLEPVIVNMRTGNLVGGHQRLAALDALEGRQDYTLTVALVDLDERTEKLQNVFLNNPDAQGEFEPELLAKLTRSQGVSLEGMGFDQMELDALTNVVESHPLFQMDTAPPVVQEAFRRVSQAPAQAPPMAAVPPPDASPPEPAKPVPAKAKVAVMARDERRCQVCGEGPLTHANTVLYVNRIDPQGGDAPENLRVECSRCAKPASVQSTSWQSAATTAAIHKDKDQFDTEFYLVVVFDNTADRARWAAAFGVDADKPLAGTRLWERVPK